MKLFIKNMVCPRCIIVVKQILAEIGSEASHVLLGEIQLQEELSDEKLRLFSAKLNIVGFELIQEPNQRMVETIKKLIIEKVQTGFIEPHFTVSRYLKQCTLKDYSTLTKVFSAYESCTIEKYFILQKLEKAKELLLYGDVAINIVARNLGYCSPQYFSSQFRKVYNYSPKEFLAAGAAARKPIDKICLEYTKYP